MEIYSCHLVLYIKSHSQFFIVTSPAPFFFLPNFWSGVLLLQLEQNTSHHLSSDLTVLNTKTAPPQHPTNPCMRESFHRSNTTTFSFTSFPLLRPPTPRSARYPSQPLLYWIIIIIVCYCFSLFAQMFFHKLLGFLRAALFAATK